MDIDEKLHKRIKDCSIRDDRTLNSTIKKVLSAGIGIIETRLQSYDDGANTVVNIVETLQNNYKNVLPDNSIGQIAQSNRLSNVDKMTDEERKAIADASF